MATFLEMPIRDLAAAQATAASTEFMGTGGFLKWRDEASAPPGLVFESGLVVDPAAVLAAWAPAERIEGHSWPRCW